MSLNMNIAYLFGMPKHLCYIPVPRGCLKDLFVNGDPKLKDAETGRK